VIRRWRSATPVVLVALLIGVPGNIAVAIKHGDVDRAAAASYRPFILTLPRLPVAKVLPPGIHPDPLFDLMTLGWLRAGVASGRIPPPPSTVTPHDRATWTLGLALQPTERKAPYCMDDPLPTDLILQTGDTITVGRGATATLVESPHVRSEPRPLGGYLSATTFIAYQDMVLLMAPIGGNPSIIVCRAVAS
jgi:hypothetical protein